MTSATPRPRDASLTRERIVLAARREFARVGFNRSTVRSIAAEADVSPNLITRYFGGKDGLFAAAAEVRLNVAQMFDGPRESLGQRMAAVIVHRWTTLEGEDPLLVLLRAAGDREEAAATLAAFLDRESLEPLQTQLRGYGMTEDDAAARARAVDIFLLGVTARLRMLRDDLGSPEAAQEWIAATIQRLING